jgi:hypothetical protein
MRQSDLRAVGLQCDWESLTRYRRLRRLRCLCDRANSTSLVGYGTIPSGDGYPRRLRCRTATRSRAALRGVIDRNTRTGWWSGPCERARGRPPVPQPPAGSVVTTTGRVSDTANLPISGAQVQLLTGPSAGTMVLTEPNGSFSIGWTAAGNATLRASKDGFQASERQVSNSTTYLRFDLQPLDTPVVIAGIYDLTLTAANECTQLPNVARQRSHRVRVPYRRGGHAMTTSRAGRV